MVIKAHVDLLQFLKHKEMFCYCMFFFMEKDKAKERSGHLMVSDYRRPRPLATPEELQVRCWRLRWR